MIKSIAKYILFRKKGLEVKYKTVHSISKDLNFGRKVRLIGDNIFINSGVKIGDYSYVNRGCSIESGIIGRFCSIAHDCIIGPPEHPTTSIITHPVIYHKQFCEEIDLKRDGFIYFQEPNPPIIEDNVWICCKSVILKGVKVGEGSIIAAGSIVTKDVPPYSIVAGVPARVIKNRRYDYNLANINLNSLRTDEIFNLINNITSNLEV